MNQKKNDVSVTRWAEGKSVAELNAELKAEFEAIIGRQEALEKRVQGVVEEMRKASEDWDKDYYGRGYSQPLEEWADELEGK